MQKKERLLLIVILVAIFEILGCSDIRLACKAYFGDKLPKDQVAWVISDFEHQKMSYPPIRIRYIDGNPLKYYGCKSLVDWAVQLPPGHHTLKVVFFYNPHFGRSFYAGDKELSFEAEPGHGYIIRYSFSITMWERSGPLLEIAWIWDAWIEDITGKKKYRAPHK